MASPTCGITRVPPVVYNFSPSPEVDPPEESPVVFVIHSVALRIRSESAPTFSETVLGTVAQLGAVRNKLLANRGNDQWGAVVLAIGEQLMAGMREASPGLGRTGPEDLEVLKTPVGVFISAVIQQTAGSVSSPYERIDSKSLEELSNGIYVVRRLSLTDRAAVPGGVVLPLGRDLRSLDKLRRLLPNGIYEVPSLLPPGGRIAVLQHIDVQLRGSLNLDTLEFLNKIVSPESQKDDFRNISLKVMEGMTRIEVSESDSFEEILERLRTLPAEVREQFTSANLWIDLTNTNYSTIRSKLLEYFPYIKEISIDSCTRGWTPRSLYLQTVRLNRS